MSGHQSRQIARCGCVRWAMRFLGVMQGSGLLPVAIATQKENTLLQRNVRGNHKN